MMIQAIGLYDFKGEGENEVSIYKNEILDVLEQDEDWWTVRNKYGQSGLVPVAYVAAPITDTDMKIITRGKTKKSHKGKSKSELSVAVGQQVAILDKSDDYWWFVGFSGQLGFIPKDIINEFRQKRESSQEQAAKKFALKHFAPKKAVCDEETSILFSFQKPLPENGQYNVVFKGDHCEKVEEGERVNDFTIKVKTPKYYPPEKTDVTINYQGADKKLETIVKGIHFMFESKLDIVHKILSKESDPLNFLSQSFQVTDLQNVDHILSGNLEKKVPEGINLLKNTKSVLVQEQVVPKETPTLLHFAAFYDLKKLAKALLRCPGAKEAMSIKNCHGNGPVGVAHLRKHEDMEQLLQDHQAGSSDDPAEEEDVYESMEKCYESYMVMGGKSSTYVQPDVKRHPQAFVEEDEELYVDMDGAKSSGSEGHYDQPRLEANVRYDDDEQLDDNANEIAQRENDAQRQIEEYKVFGRMTEKEVQLALLMKRVKERYITQEQALEMAKVLRLEPGAPSKSADVKKKKARPKVNKRVSAPNMEMDKKSLSLPRTLSVSSSSSVSSVGSTGSGSGSDRPPPPTCAKPKFSAGAGAFSYSTGIKPPVSPKKQVMAPPPATRKAGRTQSDPPPPTPRRPPRH